MSFVFWRLISRSQNWPKQYLVVLNNLNPKGKCAKYLHLYTYLFVVILRSRERAQEVHIFLVYRYPDLTLVHVVRGRPGFEKSLENAVYSLL